MPKPPTPLVIEYLDPDNVTWELSDLTMTNGYVCSAISGIEGFPMMMQTFPLLDGTAIPNVYIPQPGTIAIAILVTRPELHDHNSENDYYNLLDRIVRAFMNRRNEQPKPGTIIITRPDGSKRQINTYTTSGLDTPETGKDNKTLYSFSLSTPDPYWQDLNPNQLQFGQGTNNGILPILPVDLNNTSLIGNAATIHNGGTGLTYPTWQITGPGTPTMTNNTAQPNRTWSFDTSIPAGQQVQVVTKRGQQSVYNLTTQTNWWNHLVTTSPRDLWPLMGGDNTVTVSLQGATAQSSVVINWTNRWQRA